jgi:DNA polymerase I-like protein with 3'-5' exonuclease and polymerase domains
MRLYNGVHLLDRPSPANALRLDLGAMPMIQEMHRRGIWLNPDVLTALSSDLAARNAEIQSQIDGWVGRPFQSTSPEQVAKLLFDELNLLEQFSPPGRMKMTKGGAKKPPRPSVDDDALSKFVDVHPVVGLIQEQRAVLKLKNTYADPLLLMRDEAGRLHTTFRTTVARTGRLTSEDPNLQNIPVRSEDGRRVREAFAAQPDLDTVLGSTDLSQIEMRVAAHLSQDAAMSEVFHLDQDIHLKTVCSVYGYQYDSLTGLWRAYKSGEISGAELERARDLDINKRLPLKCYHPDTEILTRLGWKRIADLQPGEEVVQAEPWDGGMVNLSWVVPTQVFSQPNPDKELVELANYGMRLRVTSEHRMLCWGESGMKRVVLPKDLNRARCWANAGGLCDPDNAKLRVVDLKLLLVAVAVQADGNYTRDRGILFGFTKKAKADRLVQLLNEAGLSYSLNSNCIKNGKPGFTFYIRKCSADLIKPLLEKDKTLPWWWLELPYAQRLAVIEETKYWDSHICKEHRRHIYTSAKKVNVDVLQALASITGFKTKMDQEKITGYWKLRISDHALTRGGNLKTSTTPYTGDVVCLSVPSTFVLVRDGGIPVICGQSVGFGVLYRQQAEGLQSSIVGNGGPLLSLETCQSHIDNWFGAYPGIPPWMAVQDQRACRYGMVWDMFGRIRLIPGVRSALPYIRARALREAGNMPVQAGAQGIIKLAMAAIMPLVLAYQALGVICWPLLQIHDELIFELDRDIALDFLSEAREIMESVVPLSVPVRASQSIGQNWKELK